MEIPGRHEKKSGRRGVETPTNISEYGMMREFEGKTPSPVNEDEDEEDVKRNGPQLEPGEVGQAWGLDENFEGREKKGGRGTGKSGH